MEEGTKTVDTLATLMLTGSTTHQTTKTPEVHAVEVDVDAYEDISHLRGTQCEGTEQ